MGKKSKAGRSRKFAYLANLLEATAHKGKESVAEHGRYAVSLLMTFVLCTQGLFGSGVSLAFAQPTSSSNELTFGGGCPKKTNR